jgi:hypothetical protein
VQAQKKKDQENPVKREKFIKLLCWWFRRNKKKSLAKPDSNERIILKQKKIIKRKSVWCLC